MSNTTNLKPICNVHGCRGLISPIIGDYAFRNIRQRGTRYHVRFLECDTCKNTFKQVGQYNGNEVFWGQLRPPRWEDCPECDGAGWVEYQSCENCVGGLVVWFEECMEFPLTVIGVPNFRQ